MFFIFDFPEYFFILFVSLFIYFYITASYPVIIPHEAQPLSSVCPHGATSVILCAICKTIGPQIGNIGNCTGHYWSKLNYDSHFVRAPACDFSGDGAANVFHFAVERLGDAAYYCTQCHAISCLNCIAEVVSS